MVAGGLTLEKDRWRQGKTLTPPAVVLDGGIPRSTMETMAGLHCVRGESMWWDVPGLRDVHSTDSCCFGGGLSNFLLPKEVTSCVCFDVLFYKFRLFIGCLCCMLATKTKNSKMIESGFHFGLVGRKLKQINYHINIWGTIGSIRMALAFTFSLSQGWTMCYWPPWFFRIRGWVQWAGRFFSLASLGLCCTQKVQTSVSGNHGRNIRVSSSYVLKAKGLQ